MRTEKCMLAQAGDEKEIGQMIASGNWHFERKYDGERCIIEVRNDKSISLFNRSGKEINSQFPELVEMAEHLPIGIYDGEIFVEANNANKDKPTTAGRTNVRESDARLLSRIKPATFMCFDVLSFEGRDIRNEPYEARKELLSRADRVRGFCGVFPEENPQAAWDEIVANGDEGLVAKMVGSRYEHTRSPNWKKMKTWQEEDFQVVGITSGKREISALVLENGMKVNCALNASQYDSLLADLVKSDSVLTCSDGTIAVKLKKTYTAKVKFLHKSETGLRFPILHELVGF